jgi:hypothetical protein
VIRCCDKSLQSTAFQEIFELFENVCFGETRPSAGSICDIREGLTSAAGSTGRRNTVHPYRQGFEAYGLPATWLNDDPGLYKLDILFVSS